MPRKTRVKIAAQSGIKFIDPAALVPFESNAKEHPESQIALLTRGIEEFGFTVPVLVDDKNRILSGHARVRAALAMELEEVPCLAVKGLTTAQKRAYILFDNKITELGIWNDDLVSSELAFLNESGFDLSLTAYSDGEIDKFLNLDDVLSTPGGGDTAEERPAISVLGDLWLLGDHRILCGNSLESADVNRLMAGKSADMVATDPPYMVNYQGAVSYGAKSAVKEKPTWDLCGSSEEAYEFFLSFIKIAMGVSKENAAWYVWHADVRQREMQKAMEAAGLLCHQQIIWVKDRPVFGRHHYLYQHEPCFYGWRKGSKPPRVAKMGRSTTWEAPDPFGARVEKKPETETEQAALLSTVWRMPSPAYEERGRHPTQKPIEVFAWPMHQHVKRGGLVFEPFSGSGSCIIAGEINNRTVYAMDLEPVYVDDAVRRWEDKTGEVARLEDGRSFAEVRTERLGDPAGKPGKPKPAKSKPTARKSVKSRKSG